MLRSTGILVVGFGEHGDGHLRFSLIDNEERTRQALRGIKGDIQGRLDRIV